MDQSGRLPDGDRIDAGEADGGGATLGWRHLDADLLRRVLESLDPGPPKRRALKALRRVSRHWEAAVNVHLTALSPRSVAAEGLRSLGGKFSSVTGLRLRDVEDDELAALGAVPGLKALRLEHCGGVTEAGIAALGTLTTLADLRMLDFRAHFARSSGRAQCAIRNGPEALSRLAGLASLDVELCWPFTDDGLVCLAALTALTCLRLLGCDAVSARGLASLAGLSRLERLTLGPGLHGSCGGITNESAEVLTALVGLEHVGLVGCGIDGGLHCVGAWPRLTSVDLSDCPSLRAEGIAELAALPAIMELRLRRTLKAYLLKDDDLAPITALSSLTHLDLAQARKLSNRSMAFVGALTPLRHLVLQGCNKVDDRGVECLTTLTALQYLDIGMVWNISDRGMRHVGSLKGLTLLRASGLIAVGDPGFLHLTQLACLRHLAVNACPKLSDVGLRHIGGMTSLTHLDLAGCTTLSNSGLGHLAGLSALAELNLATCTRIDDDGVGQLRRLIGNEDLSVWGPNPLRCLGQWDFPFPG